jgi:hypothetical protein
MIWGMYIIIRKIVACIHPFAICVDKFQPLFHNEYDIFAHEFRLRAPTLILIKHIYNIYRDYLLLDKSNNNIFTSGQWKHNLMLDMIAWNLQQKCCTTCGIVGM